MANFKHSLDTNVHIVEHQTDEVSYEHAWQRIAILVLH
jgi:hypothetical protein